jgi:glycosyltransferase XagB
MINHERKQIGWRWMGVPLYWMMISLAAWRAVFELRSSPFTWNKTPHTPSARPPS